MLQNSCTVRGYGINTRQLHITCHSRCESFLPTPAHLAILGSAALQQGRQSGVPQAGSRQARLGGSQLQRVLQHF